MFDEIKKKYFISDFFIRSSDGCIVLYIPKDKVSHKAEKGFVSHTQLDNLQSKLKSQSNINSEIVLLDTDGLIKVSEGFVALLKSTYTNIVSDAQISFLTAHRANVVVQLSELSDNSQKEAIESFLKAVFSPANIELQALYFEEVELPSLVEILAKTKVLQPATLERIHTYLSEEYTSIQITWLNKQLDKLIKKRFLVREKETKSYTVTALGLNVLPRLATRNSSDILRALDLGRRKW